MRVGVFAGVLVAGLLTSLPVFAAPKCLAGDTAKGPNCVRVWQEDKTEFSANETAITISWVYRIVNGLPVTVWKGLGQVKVSTAQKLRIYVWFIPKPGEDGKPKDPVEYEYDTYWDGKTYATRGF